MMTLLKFTMLILCLLLTKTMNPVKMSTILLILSSMIFLILQESTQNMWFPSIFFLLFMGGILIMFMILSSLMPNEKSFKAKIKLLLPFMAVSLLMIYPTNLTSSMNLMVKWTLNSNMNMEFLLMLMLFYFLVYMMMMEKEKTPLRSDLCH